MKYILVIVALFAAGVIGYSIFNKETVVNEDAVPAPIVIDVEKTEKDGKKATSTSATVNSESGIKTFTMADVALHADTTSCYSVINDSVYDLTAWITKHPGGERGIKSICGKDGSAGFNGKHGGKSQPESTLASFKIGILAK